MHKVQEVFSKMGNKIQPAVSLSQLLQIPATKTNEPGDTDSQLPVDPDSVKSWLLANNAFNSRKPVAALLHTLKHCNRTDIAPQQRQKILQHFEKPCAQAIQWLDARYLYRDFPLKIEERSAFVLAVTLCQEMATAYKRTLYDTINSQKKRYRKTNHLNEDIAQTFKHLGRMALRYSMLYRQWPATFWLDANVLIKLAQTTSAGNDSTLPGITDQYARLCAFSILAGNKHHATELQGLFSTLAEQTPAIKFQQKPTGAGIDHYCVGASHPPSPTCFTQVINNDKLQYFSIEPLRQQLQTLQSESHSPADNENFCPPAQQGSKRASARAIRNNKLKATTGVYEIHEQIRSMPQTENNDSQFTNLIELVTRDDSQQKTRYSLFNQVRVQNNSDEFLVENQSHTGFGMRLDNTVNSLVQVGELIAHCYGDTREDINWHLGTIRWIKAEPDGALRFGVETISRHTSAVEVFRFPQFAKRPGTTHMGLLANYQPMDCEVTQLLLPAYTCKPGEIVSFKDRRRSRTVKLIETVSVNNLYQSFAIQTVDVSAKVKKPVTATRPNIFKTQHANAATALGC